MMDLSEHLPACIIELLGIPSVMIGGYEFLVTGVDGSGE